MITTRRDFVRITAVGGTSLLLGLGRAQGDDAKPFRPSAWLRIDPDGRITVTVGKSEMGQGVRTSLPMILAEELDADWKKIAIEQAVPGPDFPRLGTGGSWSIGGSWKALRQAGATAREMLLLAAAARWSVDRAALRTDRGAVIHDASGRRASYGELATAASAVPVPKNVALKSPKDFRIIGQPTKRLDGPLIVTGAAKYGIDTRVPGMLYATIVRPPAVGGSVKRFDAVRAKAVRGVRDVVEIPTGVAVVADETWAALRGRERLHVEWNDGPNGGFDSERYLESLRAAAAQEGVVTRRDGDPSAPAAKTLEATYVYPFYAHAPVETMNCVADVRGKSATLWAPTQSPNSVQEEVAELLAVPAAEVTVHVTLMGGGFGRRLRDDFAVEAAQLSKRIARPVQVLWTRADDMRDGMLQHASLHAMRAGLDESGKLVSWHHRKVSNPLMTGKTLPKEDLAEFYRGVSWGVNDHSYAIPNVETSYVRVESPVRYGPWRAVFAPSSVFARESFLDEAAHAAGRDPLQLRLDLLGGAPRLRRVVEVARDRAGWGRRPGQGVACNMYDDGTCIAYVAEVRPDRRKTLRVERVTAAVDCGPIVNPLGVRQQVEGGIVWALAQLWNQITIRNGRVEQSSYLDYPVPRIDDVPAIDVHLVASDGDQPFGMGEPPVPPLVPAVLNAWFTMSGERVRKLPL